MRVIVLEVIVCCTCSLSLIQEFYISVLVPFLAVVLVRSSDLATPGSPVAITRTGGLHAISRTHWNGCLQHLALSLRGSALTLKCFVRNKLCCALALVSVIFLSCLFIAQGCCSHLDYNSVIKPLYVHVDCYLMLLGCRKGLYQLQMCSTSPLHSLSSA